MVEIEWNRYNRYNRQNRQYYIQYITYRLDNIIYGLERD